MPDRLRIIVAGGVGAMPFAGVAWQVLQYLEGFRRLGHDVLYLEDTRRWPYDPVAQTVSDDAAPAIAYVAALMDRCRLRDAWAYRDVAAGGVLHGCSERALADWLSTAEVLVNVTGVMVLREEHMQVPARVYLETDPVLAQIEVANGRQFTIDFLSAHTHHFTYGENFGAPDCEVPIERFTYRPTRPPVILDWWRDTTHPPAQLQLDELPFTTVSNWRQSDKDVVWRGRTLTWSKDVQFMRFLPLASRAGTPIELALATEDEHVMEMLRGAGWLVRPAGPLSNDVDVYRDYIRSSAGEFSIAKEQYSLLRTGWFSDRTACYLAAGKPAIVQDTGFGRALPTGEGLFAFQTVDDAVAAFGAVRADYPRHVRAAYEIAEQYLRAEKVLEKVLADVG
jgi:hypothetical protein